MRCPARPSSRSPICLVAAVRTVRLNDFLNALSMYAVSLPRHGVLRRLPYNLKTDKAFASGNPATI